MHNITESKHYSWGGAKPSKPDPSTRQFFWTTLFLLVPTLLFPPIAWLTGIFLIMVFIGWMAVEPEKCLGVIWRTLLFVVLGYSILTIGLVRLYGGTEATTLLICGSVAFILSAGGLVRSFYLAHARN